MNIYQQLTDNLATSMAAAVENFWEEVLDTHLAGWREMSPVEIRRQACVIMYPNDANRYIYVIGKHVGTYRDPVPVIEGTTIKFNLESSMPAPKPKEGE